jgi:hypothetical protein
MTECDEVVRLSFATGQDEQRDILSMYAIHDVRHEPIPIETSARTDKLKIV